MFDLRDESREALLSPHFISILLEECLNYRRAKRIHIYKSVIEM